MGFLLGWGAAHAPGASAPAQRSCRAPCSRGWGQPGGDAHFLSRPRCWGRRGVFAVRVGSGRASLHVMGLGRRRGAAAGPVPPGRNVLGDPGVARRQPDRPRGQQSVGVRGAPCPGDPPLSSLLGSCLRLLRSQGLQQLPCHRPLDVCTFLLVNVSRNQKLRDGALCPRRPFCSLPWLEISTHAGWAHTRSPAAASPHPSVPTAQEGSESSRSSLGRWQSPLPAVHGETRHH